MSNIREVEFGKKPAEAAPCPFCHKHYSCHGKEFSAESCPRVKQLVYFDCEEALTDWPFRMVEFRDFDEFIGEIELDNDHEDGECESLGST